MTLSCYRIRIEEMQNGVEVPDGVAYSFSWQKLRLYAKPPRYWDDSNPRIYSDVEQIAITPELSTLVVKSDLLVLRDAHAGDLGLFVNPTTIARQRRDQRIQHSRSVLV